ncbi:MAG: HAD-IA family hydrolase [Candidatus Omnitrophica bacterium]|nr:HAD-IA family hydrolase [Candidatus Omnitrophota bacterium]
MKAVDSIIFDLDGTLVDSKEDIVNAVNFTLKKLGLSQKQADEIASYIGTGAEDLIRKAIGDKNRDLFDKGISIFEDDYKKHSATKSKLYPHVEEVLEYFKNKNLFIVTNRKKNMAQITLNSLGINKYFKDVVGGDDETCLKPSACSLEKALGNVQDRKRIIIVGDMDLDVLTGKEAGILTCAVTYGIGKRDDIVKVKPDYLVDDLLQLKEIIR